MKPSITLSFPPLPIAPFTWTTPLSYSLRGGFITGEYTEAANPDTAKTWAWAYPSSLSCDEAIAVAVQMTTPTS